MVGDADDVRNAKVGSSILLVSVECVGLSVSGSGGRLRGLLDSTLCMYMH
jgi:hypothetical protein